MNEAGPLKTKIKEIIDEIMQLNGVYACAIISTDGQIIGKSETSSGPSRFLGITGATMYASSEAACSTFHISPPDSIVIRTKKNDGIIFVKNAGEDSLISVMINDASVLPSVDKDLSVIAEKLSREI